MSVASRSNETLAIPGYVAGTWAIDPVHSDLSFTARHLMVSKVRGRFPGVEGTIVTGAAPEDSSVDATIDLAGVDTGNEMRDNHLRSSDFFDIATHPTARFRSTGIRRGGDGWLLDGELTLKGVTRPVVLDLELNGFGPDNQGGTRAGFSATTEINRRDWGVEWGAVIEGGGMVVSDQIRLQLEIEAIRQPVA